MKPLRLKFTVSIFLVVCASAMSLELDGAAPPKTPSEKHEFTVPEVADSMSAAADQFPELRLDYQLSMHAYDANLKPTGMISYDVVWATKSPGNLEYVDYTAVTIDDKSGARTMDAGQTIIYDGKLTYVLDKARNAKGDMTGWIRAGRDSASFPPAWPYPMQLAVFNFLRQRSWPRLLKEPTAKFHIVNQHEIVDDLDTIHIQGTWNNRLDIQCWVCPSRDFLALKSETHSIPPGGYDEIHELKDLVKLPDGPWFPNQVQGSDPAVKDKPTDVVYKLKAPPLTKVPAALFHMTFPPGTHVNDEVKHQGYNIPTTRPVTTSTSEAISQYAEDAQKQASTQPATGNSRARNP
jgi:hypothetical protein